MKKRRSIRSNKIKKYSVQSLLETGKSEVPILSLLLDFETSQKGTYKERSLVKLAICIFGLVTFLCIFIPVLLLFTDKITVSEIRNLYDSILFHFFFPLLVPILSFLAGKKRS